MSGPVAMMVGTRSGLFHLRRFQWMFGWLFSAVGDRCGEGLAIHREAVSGGHAGRFGARQNQRIPCAASRPSGCPWRDVGSSLLKELEQTISAA